METLKLYEPNPEERQGLVKAVHIHPELLAEFYRGRNQKTLDAYKRGMKAFQEYIKAPTEMHAVTRLIGGTHGEANLLVIGFRSTLIEQEFAPSTINLRLSAVRALIYFANVTGLIPWHLEVKNLANMKYRDTHGPGQAGFEKILVEAKKQREFKAERDVAILWLLFGRGLRKGEVIGLDLEHYDGDNKILVLRKRKLEREVMTIPTQAVEALQAWIVKRKKEPGPLFCNCDNGHKRNRITGKGLWQMVSELGTKCNIDVWPHALRHASINELAIVTNGNVVAMQSFSGHSDMNVMMQYVKQAEDQGGKTAQLLADRVKVNRSPS